MKQSVFPLCILTLFLLCIIYPADAISGASAGLSLWYCTVLPTLLPCMILSGYLISSQLIQRLPPFPFAFITGWFCGYPMGARTTADLFLAGRISEKEGNRLLAFCCEPSPMFLVGYLCTGMLRLTPLRSAVCLTAVYLPPVLWFFLTHKKPEKKRKEEGQSMVPFTFQESFLAFEGAMMKGFLIIVKIGGYLMLFTMLAYFSRKWISSPLLSSLITGILEMTSGTAFTVFSGLPETLTVSLCFSYAALGGLSGFFQTVSVLENTPFSKSRYLLRKVLQAAMTFFILIAVYPFF